MAQRLMEIVVPDSSADAVATMLVGHTVVSEIHDRESNTLFVRALVSAEGSEELLDALQQRFSTTPHFSVVLLPVTAAIPHLETATEETETAVGWRSFRVSREELLAQAADSIRSSPVFIGLTVLSAVVASIGLITNNLVAILGAMMIAPLLAPNITLALATTLGDVKLIRGAMKANLLGVSIALSLALAIGVIYHVDPTTPTIAQRTVVSWTDVVLALAAGAAGALAFTSGLPSVVIGVMLAVALLPPVVNFGVLIGGGYFHAALGALLLVVTNVVAVNLAGMLTFLAQGVRPRTWWEAEAAHTSSRIAMIIWAVLLTILALVLFVAQPL